MSLGLGNDRERKPSSFNDLNKFTKLCAELECALANAYGSLDDILSLKDLLLEQSLPCSLKAKLTLTVARLHRSMSDLGVPSGEITRLVRLYAVPWENKSKALKKLHQDYESKQNQLDIALKRLEMIGVHTMRMEKEKRIMNWEKLFAKLASSRGHGQRWKFLIQQFKNKIKKGENMASLYVQASDDEEDDNDEDSDEKVDNLKNMNSLSFGRRFSERLKRFDGLSQPEPLPNESKFDVEGSRQSLIEEGSETSTALPLSDVISVGSIEQDSMSAASLPVQKKVRFDDYDDSSRNNELNNKTLIESTSKSVSTSEKGCWTHEPDSERMFHLRLFKPSCKTLSTSWCSISFDKQLRKSSVFADTDDTNEGGAKNYQEFIFKLQKDFEERNFEEVFVKISVHPENKKNMIAMASLKLTDIEVTEEVKENETKPIAYQLKAMVNNPDLIFNKPCGNLYFLCFFSTVYLPKTINRSTETLSIEELTERIITLRRNEAMKRLKSAGTTMIEKPVYTEEQMATAKEQLKQELFDLRDEYEERLGLLISQLHKENVEDVREFVNAATSPLFMWSASRSFRAMENKEATKIEKKKPVKKVSRQKNEPVWGENLPEDFFERMEMFQEASSKHHQQLKEKFNSTTEKEIVKKLATQNRLDTASSHQDLQMEKDVCLPALFMPSKSRNHYSSKARSYFHAFGTRDGRVTQPPSILQLPRLKSAPNVSEVVGTYEVTSRNKSGAGDREEDAEEQLERLNYESDNSSVSIDVCKDEDNESDEAQEDD
eukprot:gene339-972_t